MGLSKDWRMVICWVVEMMLCVRSQYFFYDILHIIELKRVSVVSPKRRQLCVRDQGGFVVGYIEAHATLIGSTSIVEVAWSTSHGPSYWNRTC